MTPEQLLMTGIASLVTVAGVLWSMVSKGFTAISLQNAELKQRNDDQSKTLIELSSKVGLLQGKYDGLLRAIKMCRVPNCAFGSENVLGRDGE